MGYEFNCATGQCEAYTHTETQECTSGGSCECQGAMCNGICTANLTEYRGNNGAVVGCYCSSSASTSGSVWGTDFYTDDSSLCSAAVHAGRITPSGGRIRAVVTNGLGSYTGSTRNGVTSFSWGSWPGSYYFQ